MSEKQERAEMEALCGLPTFRKFLFRSIQTAKIFTATTNGPDGRNLVDEGRRALGLEILHDAARGMPVDDPEAAFFMLLITVSREGIQTTPEEKPNVKSDRYAEIEQDD